mgnify:CR=1 FL=1
MISIKNLVKIYNKGKGNEYKALKGIDFQVQDGELVAVIGKSGAGKSTLLHVLAGIDSFESGSYHVGNQDVGQMSEKQLAEFRNKSIGMVMQDFALIEEDTAMQNILVPTLYSRQKKSGAEYRKLIKNMAEKLKVSEKLKSTVRNLSGGERQRIAIIRSMICDQKIILADEPTGSLDKENSEDVMRCLRELVSDLDKAVVIVTHDLNVARQCDRAFNLAGGVLTPCKL